MPASIYLSDDIDEIRAAAEAARLRCNAAEAAMMAAETAGDTAALARAEAEFAQADDLVCHLGVRADEIDEDAEEENARAERMERRKAYWSAVL